VSDAPASPPRTGWLLLAATVLVVAGWQFPEGRLALYPFTLLATFAHEMGHGLTAILVGGRFESLVMHPDGSGVAAWRGDVGPLARALVAAGGLVGPSVAGSLTLVLSRKASRAPFLLGCGAAVLLLAWVLVAGNGFGRGFMIAGGVVLALGARFLGVLPASFAVQFLAATLCLSVYLDIDYMFSPGAVVDGVEHPSDSQAIANALLLPYWFWGGMTAAFSFAVLLLGARAALRPAGGGGA
jgi:hypothetical protein